MVKLFYTIYIRVDLAHHEIFHAKVGKGGIIIENIWASMRQTKSYYDSNQLAQLR